VISWLTRRGKRIARISTGVILLVAGAVLSVPGVPGPGIVVIFLGLSLLAADFIWARRLKEKMKSTAETIVEKVKPAKKP
jgi:hypothetical protein